MSAWLNVLIGLAFGVAADGARGRGHAARSPSTPCSWPGCCYLTGGIINPFSLLLIAAVTLGAATLAGPVRRCEPSAVTARLPGPWPSSSLPLPLSGRRRDVRGTAGPVTTWLRHRRVADPGHRREPGLRPAGRATESARMELALNVTETVLAREQRLSALGASPPLPPTNWRTPWPPSRWWPTSWSARRPTARPVGGRRADDRPGGALPRDPAPGGPTIPPEATDAVHERIEPSCSWSTRRRAAHRST